MVSFYLGPEASQSPTHLYQLFSRCLSTPVRKHLLQRLVAGKQGGVHIPTHFYLGDFQRLTLLVLNPMHLKETGPSKEETVAGQ